MLPENGSVWLFFCVWVFVLIVHVIIMYTRDNFPILRNDSKVIIKIISETFPELITVLRLYQGSCIHDGTWKSAVYGLADQDNLKALRKKIGYSPVPVVGAKLKRRYKKLTM